MNMINRLTLRCLKMNKRRTIVTIIGIALSVMMITSVWTVVFSFLDLNRREEIAENGEWHAQLSAVPAEKLPELEQTENVRDVLLTREIGFAPFESSTNASKPYFYVEEYNAPAFTSLQLELIEGRFPQQEGEAVIEQGAYSAGCPFQIGDAVTLSTGYRTASNLEGGDRLELDSPYAAPQDGAQGESFHPQGQKTYRITGKIQMPFNRTMSHLDQQPAYRIIGCLDTKALAAEGASIDPMLVFDPLNHSIFSRTDALAKQVGAGAVAYHSDLLLFSGVVQKIAPEQIGMVAAALLVLLVILAGFAMMLYNAFYISVSERTQYLGLLASVGATAGQKRRSVFFEGVVLGAAAIPIGLLAGTGGVGLLLRGINALVKGLTGFSQDLQMAISLPAILLTVLFSALLIVFSVFIPARKAAKTTPVEAIRQTAEIKLTGKEVKTGRLTHRLFGLEGEIALKNLKRSRGRYRTTVAALAVSMILILTVSYGASLFESMAKLQEQEEPCDILIQSPGMEPAKRDEIYQKVINQGEVTRYACRTQSYYYGSFTQEQLNPDYLQQMQKNGSISQTDGQYQISIFVYTLDEASFRAYLREIGEGWEAYQNPDQHKGVFINTFQYQEETAQDSHAQSSQQMISTRKAGDSIPLMVYGESPEQGPVEIGSVKIGAITEQMPFGIPNDGESSAYFIIPQKTGEALQAGFAEGSRGFGEPELCVDTNNPTAVMELVNEYKRAGYQIDTTYYGGGEDTRQTILLVTIFCSVLVALITLTCVANMFNTISTNLILRRREFALLQSIGMTQKGFRRMLRYESLLYGMKTLLYGLPISFALMAAIYWMVDSGSLPFVIPWAVVACTIAALFLIIGGTMLYTGRKLKKNNIIDTLKDDVI